ncbi:thioredoxin domain-containing protein [Microbacterium sp. BWT-B31]|uniref:DsbA family protein n=1 Tax=Microbacterium sp. BWT-B31 TaxID=3232072 RepID=UPI0035283BE6
MSNDETPNVPATRDRRHAVREKAQLVQAQQSRARAIRRVSLVTLLVAVIAAAAVVVTWVVSTSVSKPTSSPANVKDDGFTVSSVTGVASDTQAAAESIEESAATLEVQTPVAEPTPDASPTARPTVDIRVYVDYLATGARDFQVANVQQLTDWVNQDAATLTYYPVAMLTAKSNGTKYSLRAASAAACVATYSPDSFFAFNNELLTEQPEVDASGFSDKELADLAQGTGAVPAKQVRDCIENQKYVGWVKSATERALQGLPDTKGVALTSTSMILVNGTPYVGAPDDPKEFAQFVLTISSDAYYRTPTATPTPTPTPSS